MAGNSTSKKKPGRQPGRPQPARAGAPSSAPKAKRSLPASAPAPSTGSWGSDIPWSAAEKIFGIALTDARDRHSRLTRRELQVATEMAGGKRNRQIAEELGISPKTLDIHRANLMRKLEARTTAVVANVMNLLSLADA